MPTFLGSTLYYGRDDPSRIRLKGYELFYNGDRELVG